MSSTFESTPSGLRLRPFNEEVLFTAEPVTTLSEADVEWLGFRASKNPRQRIRICSHPHSDSRLHEMFIVHTRETYVRPHKHLDKSESFHIISGDVDVVLFDNDAAIRRVIRMGERASGKPFYYRLDEAIYHTLLIRSDVLVFHEVTTGPFRREDTVFAPWAPTEDQTAVRGEWLARLEQEILHFLP